MKTNKTNKSVKNAVKNVKNVATYEPKYIVCDFNVLDTAKDAKELKLWADDMAEQLKAKYAAVAAKLSGADKAVNKTAKKAEKTASKSTESKKTTKKTASKGKGRKVRSLAEEVAQIAITDKKAVKKLGVKFIRYTEKCAVLVGETKALHDSILEHFKGAKCINLKQGKFDGQKGWIFSNDKAKEFTKLSGLKVVNA